MPDPGPTFIPDHAPLLPEKTPFTKQTPKSLQILAYFVNHSYDVTMAESWEISSRIKWPDFYLKEIWRYRELLGRFVRRDFLAAHKQTVLGSLWILVQPLLTALTYVIVFKNVMGVSTSGRPGLVFYFISIITWGFFSESVLAISYTYAQHAAIFNKVYFPRIITSLSICLSQLVRLGIQLGIYLVIFLLSVWHDPSIRPNMSLALLPVWILSLAMMALGTGLIFATLSVRYRDLHNLLSSLFRIWMFATPVIYPLAIIPEPYQRWMALNPVTPLIEVIRYGFLGTGAHQPLFIAYAFLLSVTLFTGGIVLFNLRDGKAMDIV
jgi:lipopolysaccharide transport system permease protein